MKKFSINNIKYADLFWGNGAVAAPPGEDLAKHWNWLKAQTGNTHPGAVLPYGWVSALPYSGAYPTGYGRNGNSCENTPPQVSDRDAAWGFTHFHHSGTGYVGQFYNYMLLRAYSRNGDSRRISEIRNLTAEPGYCAGYLRHYRTGFETTVTGFAAMHRFKFDDGCGTVTLDCSHLGLCIPMGNYRESIDLFHCHSDRAGEYSGFVSAYGITIYFALQVSGNIAEQAAYNGVMEFDISGSEATAILGFSLVSESEAILRANEAAGQGFDQVRKTAMETWEKLFAPIHAEFADTKDRNIFFSALYHSCIKPVDAGLEFTDFVTMWDIYRTQLPLMMFIAPETSRRMLLSIMQTVRKKKFFPCCHMMSLAIQAHEVQSTALAVYTLADGFFCDLLNKEDYPEIRNSFDLIFAHADLTNKSMTHTLDLAGAYHAAAQVAQRCGDTVNAAKWSDAAKIWKNAYDPATGLLKADSPYYEGTLWNYSFRPHTGMTERIALAGGKEKFEALLDKFFAFNCTDTYDKVRPQIPDRFEGMNNESDMETPAAYLWCGRADKQARIHDVIRRYMFLEGVGGCPGNNDSGGLSSWYVWSCLGLMPLTGTPYMLLASPLVKSAEIPCASDRTLRIEVEKSSPDAIYPVKFEFNGREFTGPYIELSELLSGGVLRFTLSNEPCNNSPVPEIF